MGVKLYLCKAKVRKRRNLTELAEFTRSGNKSWRTAPQPPILGELDLVLPDRTTIEKLRDLDLGDGGWEWLPVGYLLGATQFVRGIPGGV
jgi:hypothetical protein